jgi:hypothetical protein
MNSKLLRLLPSSESLSFFGLSMPMILCFISSQNVLFEGGWGQKLLNGQWLRKVRHAQWELK